MPALRSRRPSTYGEQTHASPHWIVRYPHAMRYRTAIEAIMGAAPRSMLDYGAGDGHLLIEALRNGLAADRIVAYEPVAGIMDLLRSNLEASGFGDEVELIGDRHELLGASFDFVACLGVLEHMPLRERNEFYTLCDAALGDHGRALIDVPVEIGPTLLVKEFGRTVLKGRASEYGWRELIRIAFGALNSDAGRLDPAAAQTWIQDHRGFDYRLLRLELEGRFRLVDERCTPLPWLAPPLLNQEVFFSVMRDQRQRTAAIT